MDDLASSYTSTTDLSHRRGGVSWRTLFVAGAAMLIGGGALGAWLFASYAPAPAVLVGQERVAPPAAPTVPPVRPQPLTPAPAAPLTATQEGTIATRLALLEDRLARISVAADGASGNAAKAEAMLIALSARRALDRGLPLGVLEAPLRIRFGETQPVAVNAIIAAGRAPVTEDELAARLVALRGVLDVEPEAGILDRIRNGIDSLIVIRPSDAPSPTQDSRYARAIRALDRSRIDLAIVEVEAMPGARHPDVAAWLRAARLRNDAARALDLIESAAILESGAAEPDSAAEPVTPR